MARIVHKPWCYSDNQVSANSPIEKNNGEKMEVQQLDDYFGYTEKGSSLEGEIRAGVTTFLTMAYILLVNPAMLSVAGLPFSDVLFATALAAFVGCVVMGPVSYTHLTLPTICSV